MRRAVLVRNVASLTHEERKRKCLKAIFEYTDKAEKWRDPKLTGDRTRRWLIAQGIDK